MTDAEGREAMAKVFVIATRDRSADAVCSAAFGYVASLEHRLASAEADVAFYQSNLNPNGQIDVLRMVSTLRSQLATATAENESLRDDVERLAREYEGKPCHAKHPARYTMAGPAKCSLCALAAAERVATAAKAAKEAAPADYAELVRIGEELSAALDAWLATRPPATKETTDAE